MDKYLTLLIIEDSESDTELIVRQFQKGGYTVSHERVETAAELRSALKKQSWNVVIADYSLPQFNAPSALEILQESGLDIPFIVFSGTIGEQIAVALMKAGAHDCIMKDHLVRLIPAVHRELNEAAIRRVNRQADDKIRETAAEWTKTFDAITDAVSIQDVDYGLVRVNRSYSQAAGVGFDPLIGKRCYEVIHGTDRPPANCPHAKMLSRAKPASAEMFEPHLGIYLEISASPIFDANGTITGCVHIAKDITARKDAEEVLSQSVEKLRKTLAGTIQAISLITEMRDPYTSGHQRRVSNLARMIAQEMGLSDETIHNVRMAGTIHDIGKISVPAEILSKPTMLSEIEMSLIRIHPQTAYDILKETELPSIVAEIILEHHERLDGSGYPKGLKNGHILFEAKVLAVADVVEAIASDRPYRPSRGIDAALEEIEKNKGRFYDVAVSDACLRLFRERGFEFTK